jgi:SulP family sulfate permease
MLSGIGLLIIIKQIPNALGYEANAEKLFNIDANTGIGAIDNFVNALSFVNSAAIIISVLAIRIFSEMLQIIFKFNFA